MSLEEKFEGRMRYIEMLVKKIYEDAKHNQET